MAVMSNFEKAGRRQPSYVILSRALLGACRRTHTTAAASFDASLRTGSG